MPPGDVTPDSLKLRSHRAAAGLTGEALTDRALPRPAAIGAIQFEKRLRIDLIILDRLATALDVEPGELLEREEKPKRRGAGEHRDRAGTDASHGA